MNLQSMIYSKHILLKPLNVYSFLPSFLSRHTTFNSSQDFRHSAASFLSFARFIFIRDRLCKPLTYR